MEGRLEPELGLGSGGRPNGPQPVHLARAWAGQGGAGTVIAWEVLPDSDLWLPKSAGSPDHVILMEAGSSSLTERRKHGWAFGCPNIRPGGSGWPPNED